MEYEPLSDERYSNKKTAEQLLEDSMQARENGHASYLRELLEKSEWNPKQVAVNLGICEDLLIKRLKDLNIRR